MESKDSEAYKRQRKIMSNSGFYILNVRIE